LSSFNLFKFFTTTWQLVLFAATVIAQTAIPTNDFTFAIFEPVHFRSTYLV